MLDRRIRILDVHPTHLDNVLPLFAEELRAVLNEERRHPEELDLESVSCVGEESIVADDGSPDEGVSVVEELGVDEIRDGLVPREEDEEDGVDEESKGVHLEVPGNLRVSEDAEEVGKDISLELSRRSGGDVLVEESRDFGKIRRRVEGVDSDDIEEEGDVLLELEVGDEDLDDVERFPLGRRRRPSLSARGESTRRSSPEEEERIEDGLVVDEPLGILSDQLSNEEETWSDEIRRRVLPAEADLSQVGCLRRKLLDDVGSPS